MVKKPTAKKKQVAKKTSTKRTNKAATKKATVSKQKTGDKVKEKTSKPATKKVVKEEGINPILAYVLQNNFDFNTWSLQIGSEITRVGSFPKPPAFKAVMKELFKTEFDSNLASPVILRTIKELLINSDNHLSRGEMLIAKTQLPEVHSTLRTIWHVRQFALAPLQDLITHSFVMYLHWYVDKSILIEVEDVLKTGEIVELYAIKGCKHMYSVKTIGNCLHEYTCSKCGYSYKVDSSG